ncbi:MAG: hypothetical protein AB2L09_12325 [Coriobacteriia bacterium]
MADTFDWTGFSELVQHLDDLLGSGRDDAAFADELRSSLALLYAAGVMAPPAGDIFDEAAGEAYWSESLGMDPNKIDPATLGAAMTHLASRIAASVEAVQPEGDIDEDALNDLAETAAQGLLDTVTLLAGGSKHFEAGRVREAAWDWSFQFDDWGTSVLAALAALHELLWGSR